MQRLPLPGSSCGLKCPLLRKPCPPGSLAMLGQLPRAMPGLEPPYQGSLANGKVWLKPGQKPKGPVLGEWPPAAGNFCHSLPWTLVRVSQVAWERNVFPFPKPHGAFWGRAVKWGPSLEERAWTTASDALRAYTPEPVQAPFCGAWRPQPLPCPPTRLSKKRQEGAFRIPSWGQRNRPHSSCKQARSKPATSSG